MGYLMGLILSFAVVVLTTSVGFDRERVFYPTVLIAIASYYVLFAVMGASRRTLVIEIVFASGFLLLGILGVKRNLWWVVAALAGHGIFDFARPSKTRASRVGGPVSVWSLTWCSAPYWPCAWRDTNCVQRTQRHPVKPPS